jgi:hypothetical protein
LYLLQYNISVKHTLLNNDPMDSAVEPGNIDRQSLWSYISYKISNKKKRNVGAKRIPWKKEMRRRELLKRATVTGAIFSLADILVDGVMAQDRAENIIGRFAALEGEKGEMNRGKQHPPEDQGTDRQKLKISLLKRREIQAPIAACLIREFAKVIGQEKALEVATTAVQEDAMLAGKMIAEKHGRNSMKELGSFIREMWAEDDAITMHFLEESEQNLSFDVTRCRYAELYEKAKMKELGFCLSCCRDEPFARGFNPQIKLLRTQTIMQGSSHCDFRFVLE